MANIEGSESVIRDTTKTIELIKDNWSDSLGEQYIRWLEQTEKQLKHIERRREIIQLKAEKIRILCEQIISTDDKKIKTLKKIY